MERYQEVLDKLQNCNRDIILGTDQNIDYMKKNSLYNTNELFNNFLVTGLLQKITKPTRITHSTVPWIDNIYSSVLTIGNVTADIFLLIILTYPLPKQEKRTHARGPMCIPV